MFQIIQNEGAQLIAEEIDLADAISYGRNYAYDNRRVVVIRAPGEQYPIRTIWPDGMVEVG